MTDVSHFCPMHDQMRRDILEANTILDLHSQQLKDLADRVISNERASLVTQRDVMAVVVDLQAALASATERLGDATKALIANQEAQMASLDAIKTLAGSRNAR